jgi:hypothetical membrane protein
MDSVQLKSPSYDHAISRDFFLLFLGLVLTFGIGIFLYREPFQFWEHALSDLGCTVTRAGRPNRISRWVFTIGMMAEGLILLRIRAAYRGEQRFRNQRVKRWLALLGAVGFLISILPNDHFHTLHSVGVGMVVGALYFFALVFHYELRVELSHWQFYLDTALLQVAVFSYAYSFMAGWEIKQFFQKVCLIGVFYILLRSVSITKESFEVGEIFRDPRCSSR